MPARKAVKGAYMARLGDRRTGGRPADEVEEDVHALHVENWEEIAQDFTSGPWSSGVSKFTASHTANGS